MRQEHQLAKGTEQRSPRRAGRKFEIESKSFASVEDPAPLALGYGRVKLAGVQMTPIFGFSAEPAYQEVGK